MTSPPKYALRFFRWFCHPDFLEDIEGDLLEKFNDNSKNSLKEANREFIWQVLLLFRPGIIRSDLKLLNNHMMFRQNLKIGLRSLKKNRGFALLNISGLSLGILATLLIGMWVYDELTFDRTYDHSDQIAQTMGNYYFGNEIRTTKGQALQLATVLRNSYGNYFDEVVTTSWTGNRMLTWGNKKLMRSGNFMEPGIANMLSLKMIRGSRSALSDPSSILLSQATAAAIFGNQDAMGQNLMISNTMEVKVAGIYIDLPENSSFAGLTFIAPWSLLSRTEKYEERLGWGNRWFNVFVQLADRIDVEAASTAVKNIVEDNIPVEAANLRKPSIFFHPMRKWHLYGSFENGENIGGRIEYIWIFGIIGGMILFLACINFMNLSTARSERRAKEVGIRKTIGSDRAQLIGQFLSESFLVVICAFASAFCLAWIALPFFNTVTEKQMQIPWSAIPFWMISIMLIFVVAVISGSYPAIYLSSFKPTDVMKRLPRNKGNFFTLRRVLVSGQFLASIALIIGTLVIALQIKHVKNRPIGYNKSNIVTIPIKTPQIMKHYETICRELMASGDIQAASASDVTMAATYTTNSGFNWKGKDPAFSEEFYTLRATHGFGDLVDWEVLQGRDFSEAHKTDTLAFILNETAVKYMGLKNPLGKLIEWGKDASNGTFKVIGVVKDMITTSPYQAVKPMIYVLHYGRFIRFMNVRINIQSSASEALSHVGEVFGKYDPDNIFEYQFMDQEYAKKFGNEERLAKLVSGFAFLAIFISCIGLFGITALATEQRKKEIGIRKILGASTKGLWSLLSLEFLILVIFSTGLAIPFSYYYMSAWLQNFNYHIDLSWWILALGGMIALVITMITVSFHTIRAAISTPIHALRTE